MPPVEKRFYWLWCCFGVLLAGCGQAFTTNTGRTPTLSLLTFPRPTITPTAILKLMRTATPSSAAQSLAPESSQEPIDALTCYETAVGTMWCLGRVQNNRDGPIGSVVVKVYLIDQEGTEVLSKKVSVTRHVVPVGEFATFGVMFEHVSEEIVAESAFLVNSVFVHNESYSARILAENIRATSKNGTFHVDANLVNHDDSAVSDVSIFATTFNAKREITGYRQQKLNVVTLKPGENIPFSLDVVPIGLDSTRVEIEVEALRK